MGAHLGRRKFTAISAAAGALAFLPSAGSETATAPRLVEWTGLWLGSVATIRLYVADRSWGKQLLHRVVGGSPAAGDDLQSLPA